MTTTMIPQADRGRHRCSGPIAPLMPDAGCPMPAPAVAGTLEDKSLDLAAASRREALGMLASDSHRILTMNRPCLWFRVRRRRNAAGTYSVDLVQQTCSCPHFRGTLARHNQESAPVVGWSVLCKHILWLSFLLDAEERDGTPIVEEPEPCDGICAVIGDGEPCEECKAQRAAATASEDTRRKGDFANV